jgi:hypothetical protein
MHAVDVRTHAMRLVAPGLASVTQPGKAIIDA